MLSKLTIKAFEDAQLTAPKGTFVVQVNPEKISRSLETRYKSVWPVNGAGRTKQFAGIGESTLSLEFVIDATGVIPGVRSVPAKIEELRKTTADYDGRIHSPPYLQILWGDLDFPCRFERMSIDYTLFSPAGIPLRARVSAHFTRHVTPDALNKEANKTSPDLTHARIVSAGETLPQLCAEVYRDDTLYPEVARHNDLDDLMPPPPGLRLALPPLPVLRALSAPRG